MDELENFYFNGYVVGQFKKGKTLEQFNSTLRNVFEGNVKENYNLKSKYPFSKDLRPQVYDYDSSILDILFENGIPNLIKNALGYDLCLAHVQLRIADPFPEAQKERSYMEWHRDTHFYNNKLGGNAPPVYKLIYYPELNGEEEVPLLVAPGTHLRIFSDRGQDYQQLHTNKIKPMKTSMDKFLFFNTSLFHSTAPAHNNSTLRIIYSFCLHSQLTKYKEQTKLHVLYKEKLEKYTHEVEND
jgi:hypothetical protein